MIEINTEDLTKSDKHYKDVNYVRGGKLFTRKQLVGSDQKVEWNTKINTVCNEMEHAAEDGRFSTTKAAGLKQMGKQAGRLFEIEKFLYDVKKRASAQKK